MPLTNVSAINKSIKNGDIANLYYFYGHDRASLESYTKKLIKTLCPPDMQLMNLHRFRQSDSVLDIAGIVDSCEALPMFANRVVVTINDLNLDKLSKSDGDDLRKILGNLPETTTVIIYCTGVDLFKNKRNLTDKNKRFSDFCAKHGESCDFAYKSAPELGKSIAAALEKNNCRIDRRNAEHLAEICLCDSAFIKNEIEKLSAYCAGREVTAEDIESLCIKHIDSDGYSIAINILKDDSRFVYNRLQELIEQNYEVIEIVSIIAFSLADIYRAKLARQSGLTVQDIVSDFKYAKNREFAVKNAYSSCGNISVYQIRNTIEIMDKLDLDLKTRSMDKKTSMLALEQAVARCFMLASGNRRGR